MTLHDYVGSLVLRRGKAGPYTTTGLALYRWDTNDRTFPFVECFSSEEISLEGLTVSVLALCVGEGHVYVCMDMGAPYWVPLHHLRPHH